MTNHNPIAFKFSLKVICFFLSFFSITCLYSQGEASNWYFGRGAGLSFNNDSVTALKDGEIKTNEGCSSISNSKGELLFYTDGILVWDRNHNIMPNGSDLLGDKSSTQSAIIVPKPNSDNTYYIFTVINAGKSEGVRYSEVDMNLNNGNGDITSNKNLILTTPSAEKITAIKHANGEDYWVATHGWNSDEFSVFSITDSGVNTTPVKSAIGSYHGNVDFNSIGYMKFSPNGKKIALAKWSTNSSVEIFDFDSSTGIISNPIILDDFFDKDYLNGAYGIEFSPNSNLLYVTEINLDNYTSKLRQFNLEVYNKAAIINSGVTIYEGRNLMAAIQLAFDGKIYVSNPFSVSISVIESPNQQGLNCNYLQKEINLLGKFGVFGLPSQIQSLFVAKIEVDKYCLNEDAQFSIQTDEPIDDIVWDFGNLKTSNEITPTYIYETPGSYTVKAKIKSGNCILNVTKEIIIYETPIAYKAENYVICEDFKNDAFETFDLKTKTVEILDSQLDTDFQVSYFETFEDAEKYENELDSEFINKKNFQEIYARVNHRLNKECYAISSFLLIVETAIAGDVTDITLCVDLNAARIAVDLSQFDNEVYSLNTVTPHADYLITYHINQLKADKGEDPLINKFEAKINSETTIFARLENKEAGCFTTTNFKITINQKPIAYKPANLYLCDDSLNDGKAVFDLASQKLEILKSQTGKVTFHTSQADADSGKNPLDENFENQTLSQEIFVRVENLVNTTCYDITSFFIELTAKPVIDIIKTWYLCPDESLDLYINSVHDAYLWSTGETDSEITIDKGGSYSVTVYTVVNGQLSCSAIETIEVIETEFPKSIDIFVTDLTSSNNSIQVNVVGNENYLFSIDDEIYQRDNTFSNLEAGDYQVYIKNDVDCLIYTEEVYILNYPKFFTPNNDGFNDFWKINLSSREPTMKIQIFNRYGKLITQVNPLSKGWDGTLNGQLLTTSDYWFIIERPSKNKQYRGHFTLKR